MKHLRLRQRLLLLTLLPSALVAIALVIYFTLSGMRSLESEMRAKGLSTVRYLAPLSEYGIIAGQGELLTGLVQATIQDPGVKAAVIVNPKGRTLAVSGRVSLPAERLRERLDEPGRVAETDDWVAYGAPVYRSQNEIDPLFDLGDSKLAAPEIIGQIFVEFDKSELARRQASLLRQGILVVLIGLGLMAALAIRLADSLARPLLRLSRAVGNMSSGQFSTRVPAVSQGELRILEDGFNEMAQHIEEAHQSMQSRIEDATAQLVYQARHDALTGLINRREFELQLERSLDALHAGHEEFSMLYIDLDRFKPVNDTCGHLAGDELLRQIALLFEARLREEDTLGRLGGDEFGVILANCTGEAALQVARDLCAKTAEYRFVWQDKIFAIGASIGMMTATHQTRSIQELLNRCDMACQQAKAQGRNQVCVLDAESAPERRRDRSNWAARLAGAIDDGRLQIEALPMRGLQAGLSNTPITELSARLIEPGQPPVALSALIDAAERYGFAEQFDRHFIDVAITALARAHKAQRPMRCLVPLSGSSIANHRALVDHVAARLQADETPGDGLCLMIPEDIGGQQISHTIELSRRLRPLGCTIGLSEFGGELSSFNQLRSIQPSHIKLSVSLTRGLAEARASTALLRAILEITSEQDIHSIADEVDDLSLLEALKHIGVGYAVGQAVAPREPFAAWLEGAVIRGAG